MIPSLAKFLFRYTVQECGGKGGGTLVNFCIHIEHFVNRMAQENINDEMGNTPSSLQIQISPTSFYEVG